MLLLCSYSWDDVLDLEGDSLSLLSPAVACGPMSVSEWMGSLLSCLQVVVSLPRSIIGPPVSAPVQTGVARTGIGSGVAWQQCDVSRRVSHTGTCSGTGIVRAGAGNTSIGFGTAAVVLRPTGILAGGVGTAGPALGALRAVPLSRSRGREGCLFLLNSIGKRLGFDSLRQCAAVSAGDCCNLAFPAAPGVLRRVRL